MRKAADMEDSVSPTKTLLGLADTSRLVFLSGSVLGFGGMEFFTERSSHTKGVIGSVIGANSVPVEVLSVKVTPRSVAEVVRMSQLIYLETLFV